jgi:hypothetical protein
LVIHVQLDEEHLFLVSASYNQKGLLGDFHVAYVDLGAREARLLGQSYTSVKEWFGFAGRLVMGKAPEYAYVALRPGADAEGRMSGVAGPAWKVYRVGREHADKLEEYEKMMQEAGGKWMVI